MRYYKAFTQATLPFVSFSKIAETLEELQALGLADGQGNITAGDVVSEAQLTDDQDPNYISFEYGICHKILNGSGNLIDRSATEINNQQAQLEKETEAAKLQTVNRALEKGFFAFDSKEFPLNAGARSVYEAVLNGTTGDNVIIANDGNYTLLDANRQAFKDAYYTSVIAAKDNEV